MAKKTILDYLVQQFEAVTEIDGVYIVTNDKFYTHFVKWANQASGAGLYKSLDIHIVNDGTTSNDNRLGAIADINFVIEKFNINDDLFVSAGDNIFSFDFRNMVSLYNKVGGDVVLAHKLDDLERLKKRGVIEFDDNLQVIGFEEKPPQPKSHYVCPALYIFKRETLSLIREYINNGENSDAPGRFVQWLFPKKQVFAYVTNEPSIDIGTLETYNKVCKTFHMPDNLS